MESEKSDQPSVWGTGEDQLTMVYKPRSGGQKRYDEDTTALGSIREEEVCAVVLITAGLVRWDCTFEEVAIHCRDAYNDDCSNCPCEDGCAQMAYLEKDSDRVPLPPSRS